MVRTLSLATVVQLWRYYQAGIVNTAFGYGLYALFVATGLNMYVAQIVSHVLGVAFNYFTYSRYAFRDAEASKARFIISYGLNYLMGLTALIAAAQIISSPYLSGLVAVIIVSLINFFVLKHFVFTVKPVQ